ncbi:tyrosine-type recombinase/integrase [Actinoplanes sp. NPDC020271]|uniref:tyrosine-type recombinase/integrase n=1 Tax=Actinoplanes sp. NPDC020271 TaxID=3363896 RepID=UPI003788BC8E
MIAGEILPAIGMGTSVNELEQLRREWRIGYRSKNTLAAYDRDLTNWLTFLEHSGIDPLTAARTVHAHAWLGTLEAAGEAPATRGRRLAAVSAFYRWLISEGHTERANPAAIDPKRKPKPPRSPKTASLTRDHARALLAGADADTGPQALRTAAIVAVLLMCGLRVSELVGADVDELGQDRGHRVLRFTVKGDAEHVVALPAPVLERLDAYLASRDDLGGDRLPVPLGGAGARTRRPLFVTDSGGRLDRGAIWRLLRRLAKTAGITVVMSPHVLRHTYATLARDAGVPLDDVQDGLGHADPRTTRRHDHGGVRLDRSPSTAAAIRDHGWSSRVRRRA